MSQHLQIHWKDEDCQKLLAIFPEEIWHFILEGFRDPEELTICSKASPFFRELLEPQRTIYLFPEVLQLLDKNGYLFLIGSESLLNCRPVHTQWRNTIDHLLQTRPYHFHCHQPKGNSDFIPHHATNDVAFHTYFRLLDHTVEELREINFELDHPKYHDHCPFPSRHLEMIAPPEMGVTQENYYPAIQHFLENVGHHFWHAVIDIGVPEGMVDWYLLLLKYLNLLPNLKSLYIRRRFYASSAAYFYLEMALSGQLHYPLPDGNSGPFPNLRNLHLLSFCYVPECVVKKILETNQPKILEVTRRERCALFPTKFIRNPEQFAGEFFQAKEFRGMGDHWKPEVLRLRLNEFQDTAPACAPTCAEVFRKLENYKDSLVELTLSLPNSYYLNEPLNLPKIRKLDVQIENLKSLDFLLGLTALEYLFLRISRRDNKVLPLVDDRIICHEGYRHCFKECNIWSLIPTLKRVSLVNTNNPIKLVRVYKRGGTSPVETFL